ncbi:MAG: redoxin domain-containing protein [Acidobacteriota bacterium]
MPLVQVGQDAPDFTLGNQDKQPVKLSDFRGKKNVVLAFYPLDWSPVCSNENACFATDLPKFEGADAAILGISADSVWSHKAWREKLGLKYDLLSDMKRDVLRSYGLLREQDNFGERATVIVGKDGKVKYVKVQEIGVARNNEDILAELKKLS